MKIFTAKVY
jgi:hypothetical protein